MLKPVSRLNVNIAPATDQVPKPRQLAFGLRVLRRISTAAQITSNQLRSVPANDACRSAASPPRPRSATVARRVGIDGSANTPSTAASAPPDAPTIHGKCACTAAMPPTEPSATAAGTATMRYAGATRRCQHFDLARR